jgi:hypothetical protein
MVAVPVSTSSLLWLTSDGPSGGEVVAAFGRKDTSARVRPRDRLRPTASEFRRAILVGGESLALSGLVPPRCQSQFALTYRTYASENPAA